MTLGKNILFALIMVCGAGCGSALGEETQNEQVTLGSGALELACELLVPGGPGPHPAVMIVHGSGGSDRNGPGMYYRQTAEHFHAMGFVALTCDKRGVGGSGGDWRNASIDALASDAALGFKLLLHRAEVDPKKVGLWGISQAGWVLPKVAKSVGDAAFVIVVSAAGTGVTPGEQNLYDIGNQARKLGVTAANTVLTLTSWRELYSSIRLGQHADHSRLDQAIAAARRASIPVQLVPPSFERIRWKTRDQWFLALDIDHDALPDWKLVRCPILAVYGRADKSTPVDLVAERFRKEVINTRRNDKLVIVEEGAHTLLKGALGTTDFLDEYLNSMDSWLTQILR